MHMSDAEQRMFAKYVAGRKSYMEFGSGGSTLHASAAVSECVFSVESDAAWIASVRQQVGGHATLHHADIGATKEWGYPVHARPELFGRYHTEPLSLVPVPPEVVLVDGRFRVACVLLHVLVKFPDALVIVHDFWDRPWYHDVLPSVDVVDRVDTLAVFRRKESASDDEAASCALRYVNDVR